MGIRNLANMKSHGNDGIQGEAYKSTRKWGSKPITRIMNRIQKGQAIPEDWAGGSIVYIYKNKGDAGGCGNYSPIFLTKIIYKYGQGS